MPIYPTNPNLSQGVALTDVDPTNWNKFVDNINAIGADLVDARGDGQAFPGTDHTAAQATDIDDILQAIKHMIADITGETNWYNEVDIALATIARGSITFANDDATPSVTTAGRPVGMCHTATGNTAALDITDLDNGSDGQVIIVLGANHTYKTTLKAQSEEPTSNLILRSDWTEGADVAIILIYDSVAEEWTEISRSPEAGGGGGGDDNDITLVDASASAQIHTLPTAFGKEDDIYVVVKSDDTNNAVTVEGYLSETIDGADKIILRRQWESITVISDGSDWYLSSHHAETVINVQDFGATGDGSTDDTTAIQDAIDAATEGDCVFFPEGDYKISSALTVTKRLWLLGTGLKTQIYQSADTDLFQFTNWHGARIQQLCLGSAATTTGKALILMTSCHYSKIDQIYMIGGNYGIYLKGCLGTQIYMPTTISSGFFGSTSTNVWWIYGERYDSKSINHTHIFSMELQGGTGGIKITDTNNEGGIYIHGSLCEAMTAHGIYLSGIQEFFSIEGVHLESSNSGIELVYCANGSIRNCYIGSSMGVDMERCEQVVIEGGYHSDIATDDYSRNIEIKNLKLTGSTNITGGPMVSVKNIEHADGVWSSWKAQGILPCEGGRNLCDGILNKWADSVPIGFTAYPNACITQESTIVKFGDYAARVTVQAASTVAAMQYDLPYSRIANPYIKNRRSADYQWTLSGSGTSEYYCELSGSGDPGIKLQPRAVYQNGSPMTEGTLGSLTAGQFDYGDNDSLGFDTIYVRLSDSTDPDSKSSGYVESQYALPSLTIRAWAYKPETDGVNPQISVKYADSSQTASGIFSIPTDEWTPITATFNISPNSTSVSVMIYTRLSGGSPDDVCIFDGIEIVEGTTLSPVYDDNRGIDGDLSLSGTFVEGGAVSTMTGNETFAFGDGTIFIKDPGGAGRTFNPSGNFPALVRITLINIADAAETITFDSTGLNQAIAQNERGIFIFDGSDWQAIRSGPVSRTGRAATLTVAASDSLDIEILQADYVGDGTGDQVEIAAAIAAATPGTIVLAAGTHDIADDLTIPATVTLEFANGAILDITAAKTVTFNGNLSAGLHQIFTGSGTVAFGDSSVKEVYPQWWGAAGDGVTDDTTELQAAIDAVIAAGGGTVFLPSGTYNYTGLAITTGKVILKGASKENTILDYTAASGDGIELADSGVDCDYCVIEDIQFNSSGASTGAAIASKQATADAVHDLRVERFIITEFKSGIVLYTPINCVIEHGRLVGQGAGTSGGVGIQLGEDATHLGANTTSYDLYISGYERGVWNKYCPYSLFNHVIVEYCGVNAGAAAIDIDKPTVILNGYYEANYGEDISTNDALNIYGGITANMEFAGYNGNYRLWNQPSVPARCYAYRTTSAQSIPTGSETKVQLNASSYDIYQHTAWDTSTDYDYTIPYPGFYMFLGRVQYADPEDQKQYIVRIKRGATVIAETATLASGTSALSVTASAFIWCDKDDLITLHTEHDSTGAENISTGLDKTCLAVIAL